MFRIVVSTRKKIQESAPVFNSVVKSLLEEFIQHRYDVHLMKDVMRLPPPWTDNEILKQVKFTNVRREHDRQTIFFIENIAKSGACRKSLFWNTVMFRMFNISTPWQKYFMACLRLEDLKINHTKTNCVLDS